MENDDHQDLLLAVGTPIEDADFIQQLQTRLWHDMLHCPTRTVQFPGSQPVSFTKKHIQVLKHQDYYVCEKSDGVRYLLYFTSPYDRPTAFLIDRNFNCRELANAMLSMNIPTATDAIHHDTLLDGELIFTGWDKQTNVPQFAFLIFDMLLLNGECIMQAPLPVRLKHVQNRATQAINLPNFELRMKKMWKPYAIAEILELEIPKQQHGNDGLIFTPVHAPYVSGTFDGLLKWKPAELNSVDFELRYNPNAVVQDERLGLYVASRNRSTRFFAHHVWDPALVAHHQRIVECRMIVDQSSGSISWSFMRVRSDKKTANFETVVENIITSIHDNVTSAELIAAIPSIRRHWKEREAASIQSTS